MPHASVPCRVVSCHVVSWLGHCKVQCRVVSCRVVSCRGLAVVRCSVASDRVVPYRVVVWVGVPFGAMAWHAPTLRVLMPM